MIRIHRPMVGQGIIFRDPGKYPPKMRALLEEVGDEEIKKITLFRYPLNKAVQTAAKLGTLGLSPYDKLFHLGIIINDKYLLDKQDVLDFKRSGVPNKPGTETMEVGRVSMNPKLTINELLEETKKRVGNSRMTSYNAFKNNCQRFIQDLMNTGGWTTQQTTDFILQDTELLLKLMWERGLVSLGEKVRAGWQAFWNRQMEGEGGGGNTMLGYGRDYIGVNVGTPSIVALRSGQGAYSPYLQGDVSSYERSIYDIGGAINLGPEEPILRGDGLWTDEPLEGEDWIRGLPKLGADAGVKRQWWYESSPYGLDAVYNFTDNVNIKV